MRSEPSIRSNATILQAYVDQERTLMLAATSHDEAALHLKQMFLWQDRMATLEWVLEASQSAHLPTLADICPSCGTTDKRERVACANQWHDIQTRTSPFKAV
jgi:hypothetical protein